MQKSDFYFNLPEGAIAQTPSEPRDHARMMVCRRNEGVIAHRRFLDITDYLTPGDLLVLNDSKVLPARLLGRKEPGGAAIELLLLEQKDRDIWEVLTRPGRKAKQGARFSFGEDLLSAEVLDSLPGGNRLVRFSYSGDFFSVLDKVGQMPLPHYITQSLKDKNSYQTVYAHQPGSAAAPTAGLHFTYGLLDKIRAMGVEVAFVTLHVGLGTFRPVKVNDITRHHMHSEHYHLPQSVADAVNRTKAAGKRVFAVGTTSCRTLETLGRMGLPLTAADGYTDIFIYPGYDFKVVDGLITNFHLPESSLIMMVSAFMGHTQTMAAYETAIQNGYRFYSFGDAMLILP